MMDGIERVRKKPVFSIQGLMHKQAVKILERESIKIAAEFGCKPEDLKMIVKDNNGLPYVKVTDDHYFSDLTAEVDNALGNIYFGNMVKYNHKMAEIWKIDPSKVHMRITLDTEKPVVMCINEITDQEHEV